MPKESRRIAPKLRTSQIFPEESSSDEGESTIWQQRSTTGPLPIRGPEEEQLPDIQSCCSCCKRKRMQQKRSRSGKRSKLSRSRSRRR